MRSLFIDTSSPQLIISIVDDDNILGSFNGKTDGDLSSAVFPVIEDLFKSIQMVPNDIDTIFVVTGPGSFTGVRIGVTIAKTYAWALNKKVVPISSLEVLASGTDDKAISMIDARRGAVFAGGYNSSLDNFFEDQYITVSELTKMLPNEIEYISYNVFNEISINKPNVDILKIIKKHINDNGVNPHALVPNYLKLTEAEEKLKAKNEEQD